MQVCELAVYHCERCGEYGHVSNYSYRCEGHANWRSVSSAHLAGAISMSTALCLPAGRYWMLEFLENMGDFDVYDLPVPARPEYSRGCAITTACFGIDSWHLEVIRQFKDERMHTKKWTRNLLSTYYRVSPPMAERVRSNRMYAFMFRNLVFRPCATYAAVKVGRIDGRPKRWLTLTWSFFPAWGFVAWLWFKGYFHRFRPLRWTR